MCGIAGFVQFSKIHDSSRLKVCLQDMAGRLAHRGPDDSGIWVGEDVGFSHRRLAVFDPSTNASQPMLSPNRRYVLVYNGAIYNYQSVRTLLHQRGHKFRTESDTEVLLNGYIEWGTGVLDRISGMFAFALWDSQDQTLLLARDRLGEKPLYWTMNHQRLLFASEIKAFRGWPEFRPSPDLSAIHEFLTYQFVPNPKTGFQNVHKMPPATWMLVRKQADGGWKASEPTEYWTPRAASVDSRMSTEELIAETTSRFRSAVSSRMIADVPVAAFLSGGVDSSAVVGAMAEHGTGTIKTFSAGFSQSDYDESAYAEQVSQRWSTDHQTLVVDAPDASLFERLLHHYDEPFADASAIPTYLLSRSVGDSIKVVLTGDGGDEVFMGYPRYWTCRRIDVLRHIPSFAAGVLAGGLDVLNQWGVTNKHHLPQLLRDLSLPRSHRYGYMIDYLSDQEKVKAYGPNLQGFLGESALQRIEPYFEDQRKSLAAAANEADLGIYLPDDLLQKVDMATMAHGLESRSPFLDHELVEWVMQLPEHLRMDTGPKSLLKICVKKLVDTKVLDRPKQGFQSPMGDWLRGPLREYLVDNLTGRQSVERGLVNSNYVDSLLAEHMSGSIDREKQLYALLAMNVWYQNWFEND